MPMHLSSSVIILIILSTLIINFFMNTLADFLNIKNLKQTVHEEFSSIYDQTKYRKSQKYLKACTKFGFITSIFDLTVTLMFWFLKGFPLLDTIVRSWNFGPVVTGLLYAGILLLLKSVITLPFSIYSTFVIEEKFGFNKTTPIIFIIDLIKSIIIGVVLGGLLLSCILAFLEYAGPNAWMMCWAGTTIFILAAQYIVPTWILPLFNKFTPLEKGELRDAILNYAESINFSLKNIFIMDGSKRSTKSNAFFTGFGKNKRIVLFDTLIQRHSTKELVAVLAHEMGHFKKKHIIKKLSYGIIHMGVIFYLLSLFISHQGLFDAFFMDQKSIYAGLIFFSMLFSPIDFFLSIFMQAMSRKDEYEADKFAADTTYDKKDMINALKKLSVDNLSNLSPHPFYVFLHYSHPPVLKRIKAIRLS